MKLIAGLGNPGSGYSKTRHNVGFEVVQELARRHNVSLRRSKWRARTAKFVLGEDDVLLMEPTTYMNLSGWALQDLTAFYKIGFGDMLVVVDDADLPLGRLRVRKSGSAGGHNGLKSIIEQLGTQEFPRLRVGVGRQPGDLKNHVLGRFDAEELASIDEAVRKAADAVEMFVTDGILKTMNMFNKPEAGLEPGA